MLAMSSRDSHGCRARAVFRIFGSRSRRSTVRTVHDTDNISFLGYLYVLVMINTGID